MGFQWEKVRLEEQNVKFNKQFGDLQVIIVFLEKRLEKLQFSLEDFNYEVVREVQNSCVVEKVLLSVIV